MSSLPCPPLPFDTARAAESVFGKDHPYLKIGGILENLWEKLELSGFEDPLLSDRFYPYSLITTLQYWEYLTDQQMSQATRMRLDMKYALHLPLNFPGIEASTLCEFRQHVLGDPQGTRVLQEVFHSMCIVAEREKSIVDVKRLISALCLPSRAETILECMGIALEAVASRDPNWLKMYALPHWYRRYYQKFDHEKIPRNPREIEVLIQSIGNDGRHLLETIENSNAGTLKKLPEIQSLETQWQRQFVLDGETLKFRKSHCLACNHAFKPIKPYKQTTRKEGRSAAN